jgi:hypothetical protein
MSATRYWLGAYRRLLNYRYQLSLRRIRQLKDRHKGQRAFIIGNGPSLKRMDLSPLHQEVTFGLNRIYLLFDRLGLTTYYVAVNRLVIEQCAGEIATHVPGPKFIDWEARRLLPFTTNTMYLKSYHEEPRFFTDITRGIWQGMTVTYVALQIAYYLGFDQVVLIGVDHAFVTQGPPHQVVVTQDRDPNHFNDQYFGKGFRWQLPDLEGSELAYRMARYQYERAGREIVDATLDGKLQVFRKVEYDSLFR